MGYTTDFTGSMKFDKKLTDQQVDYINKFSNTRRMKRDVNKLMKLFKGNDGLPEREILTVEQETLIKKLETSGLDVTTKMKPSQRTLKEIYGKDGEYFVGDLGMAGQNNDESVIDHNTPPSTQPGLWCQWVVTNTELEWDGGEKFYDYIDWLLYLIDNFFNPWGVLLNGEIEWQGEESDDFGKIVIVNSNLKVKRGKKVYN